jgi:transcriptional regulator with XRE-family HTH domain
MSRAYEKLSPRVEGEVLPEVDWKSVGERIRSLRGHKMHQVAFAKLVGVTQSHISAVERGEKELGAVPLFRIAVRFDTTVEWLLVGELMSSLRPHVDVANELLAKGLLEPAVAVASLVFEKALALFASQRTLRAIVRTEESNEAQRLRAFELLGNFRSHQIESLMKLRNTLAHSHGRPNPELVQSFVSEVSQLILSPSPAKTYTSLDPNGSQEI